MGANRIDKYYALVSSLSANSAILVERLFDDAIQAIAQLTDGVVVDLSKPIRWSDFPPQKRKQVERIFAELHRSIRTILSRQIDKSWTAGEARQSVLASEHVQMSEEERKLINASNLKALEAFKERKVNGLNLSQRVWQHLGQTKAQMELMLSRVLKEMTDRNSASHLFRKYLADPDGMYAYIAQGVSPEETKRAMLAYRPGVGVYRDPITNVQRMLKTEITRANRTAEWEQMQRNPYVISFEVRRSGRKIRRAGTASTIECPLCDKLVGVYPKTFRFTTWHPNCECQMVPKYGGVDNREFRKRVRLAIANGGDPASVPNPSAITELPSGFRSWVQERLPAYKQPPHFAIDNKALIFYHKPTAVERAKARHEARTPEQVQAIQRRWDERKKQHALIAKTAVNVLAVAQGYNEVDFSGLQSAIESGDLGRMKQATKAVAMAVSAMKKLEQSLSDIIPNAHEWHKQFTIAELQGVHKAVGDTLDTWLKKHKYPSWEGAPNEHKKKKLEYEIEALASSQKYSTWKVAEQAYLRKLGVVQDAIDLDALASKLKEHELFAQSSATKAWKYKANIKAMQGALKAKNKLEAKTLLSALDAHKLTLQKKLAPKTAQVASGVIVAPTEQNPKTQNAHVSCGSSIKARLLKIGELTGAADVQEARDFYDAVDGFSCQWDFEIRQVQCGNDVVSRHGHTMEEIIKRAQNLERFIARSPQWAGGTTYRGMSLSELELQAFRAKLQAGIADMRGSASWSTKQDVALNFTVSNPGAVSNEFGDKKTRRVVCITNSHRRATSIMYLSYFDTEYEVVASMICRYRLVREYEQGGITYFEIESI